MGNGTSKKKEKKIQPDTSNVKLDQKIDSNKDNQKQNQDIQNGLLISESINNQNNMKVINIDGNNTPDNQQQVLNEDIQNQFQPHIVTKPSYKIRNFNQKNVEADEFYDALSNTQSDQIQQKNGRQMQKRSTNKTYQKTSQDLQQINKRNRNSSKININDSNSYVINNESHISYQSDLTEIILLKANRNLSDNLQSKTLNSRSRIIRHNNFQLSQDQDNNINNRTHENIHQNGGENGNLRYGNKRNTRTMQRHHSPVKMKRQSQVKIESPKLPKSKIGLCGLQNIGNTCYMYLKKKNIGLVVAYSNLINQVMKNGNRGPENPISIKKSIERYSNQFQGYNQQDAQEFMINLLEGLHEEINKGKKPKYQELKGDLNKYSIQEISNQWFSYYQQEDDSHIQDYFRGQLISIVKCNKCQNKSVACDNFHDMSLSFSRAIRIVEDPQIYRLFQWYLDEEQLDDEYYSDPSAKDCLYDLVGIVNHSGSLQYGHYTSQCKNMNDQRWYEFNDESVSDININNEEYETNGSAKYKNFY
ncbi:hypothetical protein PPERSA_01927 [Pseudocohnilembus persalinus]|uniref:USP domain-containing protein n=1 Tax=Pseudocohnilembus persalinus TaxID=266149 RepID=A0A0V0R3W5_PSEPJ|nr:hypothetical protein PPERSA_01927 [Pseudocohnilembus persalinus]|eukprot:KRX09040.1 hypothetical protein PPERSA_01927 [Pseudocohnilembus persalinus]